MMRFSGRSNKIKQRKKASYTVEASMTLPLFIFVCACILLFFRILTVEWGVAVALNETAREIAVAGGGTGKRTAEKTNTKKAKDSSKLKQSAVALAKARIVTHRTPLSVVRLGIVGMDFSKSNVDDKDVCLVVSYKVPLPVSVFGIRNVSLSQCAKAHRWVGFDPAEGKSLGGDGDTVYITESGKAYHKSSGCSYLNPSIRPVSYASVSGLRNTSGHKYYACPLCKGSSSIVYITTYGENYHTSVGCSGLKRTIRTTTEKKAKEKGYHACSKCAK